MPHPSSDVDARAHRAAAYLTDPGTDADDARRYDALYREPVAEVPWRGRAVRQYEPSLRAPENAGDDPFGWLYRDSADSAAAPPAPQPVPVEPAPVAAIQAPQSPEWVVPPVGPRV